MSLVDWIKGSRVFHAREHGVMGAPSRARSVLLRKAAGLSTMVNHALGDTWTTKLTTEGPFDAVRLWLPNPRTDSAISFDAIAVAST